jgi:hypothetical protein
MAHQLSRWTSEGDCQGERVSGGQFLKVQSLFQDPFDGHVCWIVETQSPGTGCIQPFGTETVAQSQQPSRRTQSIFGPVVQQAIDNLSSGRSNLGRLLTARMACQHQAGYFVGW